MGEKKKKKKPEETKPESGSVITEVKDSKKSGKKKTVTLEKLQTQLETTDSAEAKEKKKLEKKIL